MSNDDLEAKREFVEKMKEENPRAFEFLGKASTNLLADIENDMIEEFYNWYKRAIKVFGSFEKVKTLIMKLLDVKEE